MNGQIEQKDDWQELIEHLRDIVHRLIGLAPTRNKFSQMLFVISEKATPLKLEEAKEIWSKTFSNVDYITYLRELGIEVGENIVIKNKYSFAGSLIELIERVFEILKSNKKTLEKILNENIPDLDKEWIRHKLLIVFSEPTLGQKAKAVLNAMKDLSPSSESWETPIKDIIDRLKIDEIEFYKVRDLLVDFGIVERLSGSEQAIKLSWKVQNHKDVLLEVLSRND